MRTLTIYRERYTVEDDGHGGSDEFGTETITERHELDGFGGSYVRPDGRVVTWRETPARVATSILRDEGLSYGADGGDWFGRDEPSVLDYGSGEEERVTGHLEGFTDAEERAVIRMLAWLDARDAARLAEYVSRIRT